MPRQARLDVLGVVQHVMARGIEGRDIFRDERDRKAFLRRLSEVLTAGGARLFAWCLLGNHFHLLLRPEREPLSRLMRRVMTGYSVVHNLRHQRKGHLFQNRYKSIVVEEEPYFLELVRYIHLNPIRAGMVSGMDALDEYPHSGHAVILGRAAYPCQDAEEVLCRFASRRRDAIRRYREFVAAGASQGRREDLRGGGLLRSEGGWEALAGRKAEERVAADARVLGTGEFVEALWRKEEDIRPIRPTRSVKDLLLEVSEKWGVEEDALLGLSRARRQAAARREFLLRAVEEAGAPISSLARACGRTYVAVWKAVEQARAERAAKNDKDT